MTLYCNPGYCNPAWQSVLESSQFATFDQIWNHPIDWIDTPNQNRGGWSGVGCVKIVKDGRSVTLFVKKQQNHVSRTWRHPLKGEPTFLREFQVLQYFKAQELAAPDVVFFAQRIVAEGQQAILITQMLEGYQPLDTLIQTQGKSMPQPSKRILISCVADAVKRMHGLGVQHRALYPKHIFVRPVGASFDVAFIDLEKSRQMILSPLQSVNDLITFNYRTTGWNLPHRLYFLERYFSITRLNGLYKMLWRWIAYKTRQKQHQWNSEK